MWSNAGNNFTIIFIIKTSPSGVIEEHSCKLAAKAVAGMSVLTLKLKKRT